MNENGKSQNNLEQIADELYDGNAAEVAKLVQQALSEGIESKVVLKEGLITGMDKVGRDFKSGEIYVPEVLVSSRAMYAGMDILKPLLVSSKSPVAGKFIIGTVMGDIHEIGKNLIIMMLEGAGFEMIDLGTDVPPEAFVEAIRVHHPQIVGMSALLSTTMNQIKITIHALEHAGVRKNVKVIVGGAPVTESFAMDAGADAYAPDAASAVDSVRALLA
jgi:5-methyltetrahydrofolate--homocysteine methyltransferase